MMVAPTSSRDFAPNQRWSRTWSIRAISSTCRAALIDRLPERPPRARGGRSRRASLGHQPEPVEAARRERQQVGQRPDLRKACPPEHLLRDEPLEAAQVELDGLCRAPEVVDAEDDVLLVAADVREDVRVVGRLRLVRTQPEHGMLL